MKRFMIATLAAAALAVGTAKPADAATILVFGQEGGGLNFTATDNLNGTTTVKATNLLVDMSFFFGTGGSVPGVFFNYTGNSVGAAISTGASPVTLQQDFSGSFSFTSGANGTGTNYLSGTFTTGAHQDDLSGTSGGTGANYSETTGAGDTLAFTSSFGTLIAPLGFSLSLISVTPGLSLDSAHVQPTFATFGSSVSGNLQADQIVLQSTPEPASMLLLGTGLVGIAGAARRRFRRKNS